MVTKDQRKLNIEAALRKVEMIHDEYIDTKRAMRRELEAQYEAQLEKIRIRESLAANAAKVAGASLTRIGKMMGTSDWKTINDRLALTAFESEEVAKMPKYTLDHETMTAQINWVEWDGVRTDGVLIVRLKEEYAGANKWSFDWDIRAESDNPLSIAITVGSNWVLFDELNTELTNEMRSK